MTDRVVIVDADSIVYAACVVLDDGVPASHAMNIIKRSLTAIREATEADIFIPVIGGDNNFRYGVSEDYKANRVAPVPEHLNAAQDYIVERWDAVRANGMEADDYVGITNYAMKKTADVVMVHIDKDLNMLAGKHYNYKKDEWYDISDTEADRVFYTQCLVGDKSDNIKGLFHIRGKKAMPALKNPIQDMDSAEEMQAYVKSVYIDGLEDEGEIEAVIAEMNTSAQLLWIRRG